MKLLQETSWEKLTLEEIGYTSCTVKKIKIKLKKKKQ